MIHGQLAKYIYRKWRQYTAVLFVVLDCALCLVLKGITHCKAMFMVMKVVIAPVAKRREGGHIKEEEDLWEIFKCKRAIIMCCRSTWLMVVWPIEALFPYFQYFYFRFFLYFFLMMGNQKNCFKFSQYGFNAQNISLIICCNIIIW